MLVCSCADPHIPKSDHMDAPIIQIGNARGGSPEIANKVGALLRKNGIPVGFESGISFSIWVRETDAARARTILRNYSDSGSAGVFISDPETK